MLRVNFKWGGGSKHMMSMRSQMGVSALDIWKEEKKKTSIAMELSVKLS